ncbi:MAG: DUF4192 domain-containing protein [Actinomycetales bacterium]
MTSNSAARIDRAIRVTTPQQPISLANPDAVAVAIPYLLGFRPEHSVVLLWIEDGRLALTQRVDLPSGELSADQQADFVDALLNSGWDTNAHSVIACVISATSQGIAPTTEPERAGSTELRWTDLVVGLGKCLEDRGVQILDALLIDQRSQESTRWWSYLCAAGCCPPQGREVPESVRVGIAAAFTLEGFAVANSRTDIVQSLQADPSLVVQLAKRLRRRSIPVEATARERWRTAQLTKTRQILGLTEPGSPAHPAAPADPRRPTLSVRQLGEVLHSLGDVRVRDCVLWSLSRADDLRAVVPPLMQSLCAAPDDWVPPVSCCVAVATWLSGDGARASMAVERALTVEPTYSLARLLDLALRSGMPPTRWAAMMAGLSEQDCRGGNLDNEGLPRSARAL